MAKKTSKVKSKKMAKKAVSKKEVLKILEKGKINFDYIKSYQFRVIRVDGAHGGITPKGQAIQMALFSERQPIPRKETYRLKEGRLGEKIKEATEQREAIIREVEVEALMDLETAKAISKWLEIKIKLMTEIESKLK